MGIYYIEWNNTCTYGRSNKSIQLQSSKLLRPLLKVVGTKHDIFLFWITFLKLGHKAFFLNCKHEDRRTRLLHILERFTMVLCCWRRSRWRLCCCCCSCIVRYMNFLPIHFQDLPEKWANTKKLSITVKQAVAPLQANEVMTIQRKSTAFDVNQHKFREDFRKLAAFRFDCEAPYPILDKVRFSSDYTSAFQRLGSKSFMASNCHRAYR